MSLDWTQIGKLLEAGRVRTLRVGDQFGRYKLVELIGQGGMGIVFRAVHLDVHRTVAIKFLPQGELADEADIRNFLAEAERQVHLKHPHVVPVFDVDRIDGQIFFMMPLYERSLADSLAADLLTTTDDRGVRPKYRSARWSFLTLRRRPDPRPDRAWRDRVELLVNVARGVQHAHERGVIHRDLKPGNILVDKDGVPHVADFGLAKRLDETGVVGGTPGYMAPEQADSADLTVAVDIYALGAILFELLTGQSPFRIDAAVDVLEQVRNPAPTPLRSVKPVPEPLRSVKPAQAADLERICTKCLAKKPGDRYATAGALARDLECVLAPRAISIPPSDRLGRAVHWLRRRPTLAWSLVLVPATVLLAVTFGGYWLWQTVTDQQKIELNTNAEKASGQASKALFQLKEFADRVERAADEKSIIRLAQATSYVDEPGEALKRIQHGFDAAFVLDKMGLIRAQWPKPRKDIRNKSYAFRDYFQALQGSAASAQRCAYVAPALKSERDDEIKFALSAPLFDQGQMVGVLVALVVVDSVFGNVRMQMPDGRVSALLGPRDIDRNDEQQKQQRDRFVVITHKGLTRGQEVKLPNPPALLRLFGEGSPACQQLTLDNELPERNDDYIDPVAGFEKHWQAAFAPVGRTGYVISVQTPQRGPWAAVKQWLTSGY